MILQEVVLCTTVPSSGIGSGLIALHDIQTGISLASFKQTNPAAHCTSHVETKNGIGGVIFAAQSEKAILNLFSFHKDQAISKIVLPQKLCCIAVDPRGEFFAGGTANGRLYLWEIASGILFNSFEAHYRRLSVLRFTQDGAGLVSASDDSGISVWSMSRLLDEDGQNETPSPYCSFSDHTLPVTDVSCGVGAFPSCRILTSSIDHTVKLWDLSTRSLLTSFLFPQPIAVLAMDPSERFFFAASRDGSVHQINLFRKRADPSGLRAVEAVGGAGMSDVIRLVDENTDDRRLISVDQPVTAFALSMTASLLLTGTSTGQIHIHDIASHQLLRSINTHKDKGLEITSLATLLKPADLLGHVNIGDGGAAARDAGPVRPVASFQRTKDASAREIHEVPIMLPIHDLTLQGPIPDSEELLQEHQYFVDISDATASNGTSLQTRLSELESEVAGLKEQLGNAKGLNDAMWENIVQKVITRGDQPSDDKSTDLGERPGSRKRSRIIR